MRRVGSITAGEITGCSAAPQCEPVTSAEPYGAVKTPDKAREAPVCDTLGCTNWQGALNQSKGICYMCANAIYAIAHLSKCFFTGNG